MSQLQNSPQQETNVIHYLGILICTCLALLGVYQMFTNRIEDGVINIIIGSSLSLSFIPFDYNKAPLWQKGLIISVGVLLLIATVYLLYNGFTQ